MYKIRRKPIFPRPQRLIAVDSETGQILQVIRLNYDEKEPTEQCILEHRSFNPRYTEIYEKHEDRNSVVLGYCYQEIHKLQLFLTNTEKETLFSPQEICAKLLSLQPQIDPDSEYTNPFLYDQIKEWFHELGGKIPVKIVPKKEPIVCGNPCAGLEMCDKCYAEFKEWQKEYHLRIRH